MKWYIEVLKKYAVFNGRARRKEYWMFILFYAIIMIFLYVIEGFFNNFTITEKDGIIIRIYRLALIIPFIAVYVRRMHDIGKSGWYCLIPIYNLYLACKEGVRGENEYGIDPKQINKNMSA